MSSKENFRTKQMQRASVEKQPRAVESDILKLLLEEEKFIEKAMAEINPSDIQNARVRHVIEEIFRIYEGGNKVNLGSLMNSIEDENTQKLISELFAEDEIHGDRDKMCNDYISKIKNNRIKERRKVLTEKIREAENLKDFDLILELTKEFNNLIKNN